MGEVIYEMSRKGLGMTTVVEGEKLRGPDQRRRPAPPAGASRQRIVRPDGCGLHDALPESGGPDTFAIAALDIMEQKKITSLPVVDDSGKLLGVLHLHDLWGTQML